jgi:hypothetical protein
LVFKIGGPKLQKIENRGTKTAFKPKRKVYFTLNTREEMNKTSEKSSILINKSI